MHGDAQAASREGGSIQCFRGISKPVSQYGNAISQCNARAVQNAFRLRTCSNLLLICVIRPRPQPDFHQAMHFLSTTARGPIFMLTATCSYVINDTMMKLATEGLPPYEVLFLRGVAALLLGMPMLLMLGYRTQMHLLFEP